MLRPAGTSAGLHGDRDDDDRDDGEDRIGFIAHEAQTAIFSAATGSKDAVEADNTPVLQSLNVVPIVAVLTQQLQDAHRRIDRLEARLATLEARAA